MAEEIIGGYRLRTLMMTGQSSQVWEVVEVVSNRHFAMKLLLPEKAREAEHRKFLFHEAEVGKQLAHPNIVKIVMVIKDQTNPCFVMEYFPAGSLRARIVPKPDEAQRRKQEEFLREKAHDIFKQWATGLAFMNAKGWVHRDVKPDNILVNSAGECRLIDFALAQRSGKGGGSGFWIFKTKPKIQGTRSYMSPEQIKGESLDGRADIYSFGASCYEVVTGRPPFRGATSHDLLSKHIMEKPVSPALHNPDVTSDFADLVIHCLQKKRDDRPKTFHDVLMSLRGMKVYKSASASEPQQ